MKAACVFLFLLISAGSACGGGPGIKLLGLNVHLIDSAVEWGARSPNKLDSSGRIGYLPGCEISWQWDAGENRLFNASGYRFSLAGYLDTMERRSGYLHLGLRWDFPFDARRGMSAGLGPTLFFRETWRVFPDYQKNQFLLESDNFLPGYEYLWLIFGDIDYRQKITEDLKLVVSMVPAFPFSLLFSIGFYWDISPVSG